jgi:S-DNA-T family DNA segregation ATPase FtsK/SpoIIIE
MPTEAAKPKRLQGCYVSDAETERLVYFWGSQRKEETPSLQIAGITAPATTTPSSAYPQDPLLETARELLKEHKHISTSFLQRKLRIGYPRAARIMEQLEEESAGGEEG